MKLRQARKVHAKHSGEEERPYRDSTLQRANRRVSKTASSKASDAYFDEMMQWLGPAGRALIIQRSNPAGALRLLLSTPESKWGRFGGLTPATPGARPDTPGDSQG